MAGKEIITVGLIYIKDKKILVTRTEGVDLYYMPGGTQEPGETDEETLGRELKEEISVELVPGTMKFMVTFKAQAHGWPDGTFVKMNCYTGTFKGEIKPSSEVAEASWLGYSDRNKVPPLGHMIFDWLKERGML